MKVTLQIDEFTLLPSPRGACVMMLMFSLGFVALLAVVNVVQLSVPASKTPPCIVLVPKNYHRRL